ncbi:MAG: hydantoinase B/oxoprolinase family protein [Acidobacteria bacterium]|nr:MAG: hydantoinase B/oxoprolinase family protein [Acidobacteriota bacterium]
MSHKVDPVTTAILQDILLSITRQMDSYIERASPNFVTAVIHDVSTGIFTKKGEVIALESHISNQSIGYFQIGLLLEEFDEINPGDVFVMCDPYLGAGTHPPDWSFFRPIFYKGNLEFFVMIRTHQVDNGSWQPRAYNPMVYDLHSEGLRLRPTRIFENDKPVEAIYTLILDNVRRKDLVQMDHLAMNGAMRLAETRLLELLDKYGRDTIFSSVDQMWEATRSAVKSEIGTWLDGEYEGESSCDDDGITLDVPVTVRVKVKIEGERLVLDFSKSDPQVKGIVNAPRSLTHVKASYAIYSCFPPELSRHYNQGSYDAFELVTQPGTVTDAQYPAPCGACTLIVAAQILEAVWMALGQAIPEKVPAANTRPLHPGVFMIDPRKGRLISFSHFWAEGGNGALHGCDGWPHTGPTGSLGTLKKPSIELSEALLPLRALRYQIHQDACGHGRWRGGPGTIWEIENLGREARVLTGNCDGVTTICPMAGRLGGQSGKLNQIFLIRGSEKIPVRAARNVDLQEGDRFLMMSGGGGGVGNPLEREVEKVKEDVEEGVLSFQTAREVYGVVLDATTYEVDQKTTDKIRSELLVNQ